MLSVVDLNDLVKWHKSYGKIQKSYFKKPVKIRREKQIEDFVRLNGFKKCHVIKDNYILDNIKSEPLADCDIIVLTSQHFSRYRCDQMIARIKKFLDICPRLYLCLNRYYVNIDNSHQDASLSDNPNLAITQWLSKNLDARIVDMSLDYDDDGRWFTWVIPDRHYFITK